MRLSRSPGIFCMQNTNLFFIFLFRISLCLLSISICLFIFITHFLLCITGSDYLLFNSHGLLRAGTLHTGICPCRVLFSCTVIYYISCNIVFFIGNKQIFIFIFHFHNNELCLIWLHSIKVSDSIISSKIHCNFHIMVLY
jgi:hypothetical protein